MKVTLRRTPGNGLVVHVCDPRGQIFGSLDSRTSAGLAPLLDGLATNGIRVSAMIEPRRKRPGEVAGQSIPEGMQIYILIVLYSPRKHADHIGTVLSKKQLWLRMPPKFDSNTDYYNPQAPNVARTKISTGNGIIRQGAGPVGSGSDYGATSTYVFRTVEEIRNDVINMFDSLTKTEDIAEKEQDPRITTKLLKHQRQALHFMTEREKEHGIQEDEDEKHSLWTIRTRRGRKMYYNVITGYETSAKPPPVLGGILADMMGLGKTLSILSLIIDTLSAAEMWRDNPGTDPETALPTTKATLLVSPVSTVANWEEQLRMHIEPGTLNYYIYHGSNRTKDFEELMKYDIVLTTYSVVAADFGSSKSTKPLMSIDWFRIVLDEAHMIRTQSTRQSQAICALSAQRRWAVTGTPVQNRLDDLGALIKFLRIRPFDEKGGFAQYILSPFKNADPEILPKLRLLVDSITLRRLKDRIDLPKRHDHIVRLEFSDDERKLYEWFAKDATSKVNAVTGDRSRLGGRVYVHILRSILRLRLICAHGTELLSDEDMKLTEGLSYGNAIDLGDDDEEEKPALSPKQAYDMFHLLKESDMDTCSVCQKKLGQPDPEDETDGKVENTIGYMTPCYQVICSKCMPEFQVRVKERTTPDNYMTCPICDQYVKVSFFELSMDKLEEDEESRAKLRSNTRLTKQLTRYGGPHTKTIALIQSLLESQKWSDEHPDEPPIKRYVNSF
jgi:SNF2 family DNA or RNA helicase